MTSENGDRKVPQCRRPDSMHCLAYWELKFGLRRKGGADDIGTWRPGMRSKLISFEDQLRAANLRPTRQRVDLTRLIFGRGDRHLSAEELHAEAKHAGITLSLATVYNTLRRMTQAGLVRQLAIEGPKTYFDTNTTDHDHVFIEEENRVVDIDPVWVDASSLPEPPQGMRIASIDVVVRLVRNSHPETSFSALGSSEDGRPTPPSRAVMRYGSPQANPSQPF